jgi:hypothetical protein
LETKIRTFNPPMMAWRSFFDLEIVDGISKVIGLRSEKMRSVFLVRHPSIPKIMKNLERFTLMTVTTVCAGYLIQRTCRNRAERVFRLAAGESPYERTHPKHRGTKKS